MELSPLAGLLGSRRHVEAALALEPVEARLVHGDLTGHNMRWSETGDRVGVTDWDLAQAFDPAVDVACLAVGHGWDAVRHAVDSTTYSRARTWAGTFAMEQLVRAVLDDSGAEKMALGSNA